MVVRAALFVSFAILFALSLGCGQDSRKKAAFIDTYLGTEASRAKVEVTGRVDPNAPEIEEHPEFIAQHVLPPNYMTPNVLTNKVRIANNYIRSGRYSAARDELLEYLRHKHDDPIASFLLALAYLGIGDEERQEKMLLRTLALDSKNYLACYNLGCLYLNKNDEMSALYYFDRCLDIDRANIGALYNKSLIAMRWRKYDSAVHFLRTAQALSPERYDILCNLGVACENSGRKAMAEGYYSKALELNPKGIEALDNISALFIAAGRAEEALSVVLRWREMEPNSSTCKYRLACIASLQGDFVTAERFLKESLDTDRAVWARNDMSLQPLFKAVPSLLEILE